MVAMPMWALMGQTGLLLLLNPPLGLADLAVKIARLGFGL